MSRDELHGSRPAAARSSRSGRCHRVPCPGVPRATLTEMAWNKNDLVTSRREDWPWAGRTSMAP